MKAKHYVFLVGWLAVAPAVAVAQQATGQQGQAAGQAAGQAGEQAGQVELTDAQIAMVVVAANKIDIQAGKLAEQQGRDRRVKELAEGMVRDHTALNEKANALVDKLGIKPKESATSQRMQDDAEQALNKLKSLNGVDFDRAYVDQEVRFHEAVVELLDSRLLPGVQNAELKALLQGARPVIVAHLEHAKGLQAALRKP